MKILLLIETPYIQYILKKYTTVTNYIVNNILSSRIYTYDRQY